ncbi:hypothetical protein [Psychroserpens ponticola]|uniref:Anti-sigma factor n=1 Tax=Psychroserpens ponticola TaxID=2932268 RepID=A0ABY7RUF9_9FLAO|nr:hypothetical protein [Psychroserpens ponticola]WCO00760.1 hypothetical protein MUN68_011850 [Psychroserpens ponticola]
MKQDIRDLFKDEEASEKQLPEHHRKEFYDKLKAQESKQPISWLWLKIAAIFIIALTFGFLVFTSNSDAVKVSPIIAQIEAIEDKYLKDIDLEWGKFVAIAEDEILVERFKKKLAELDKDYQEISEQFKTDSNNIMVIEDLVNNLQIRLKLLKDIQSQIKLIDQKNEHYENSI